MTDETLALTGDLDDMLVANSSRPFVDPRTCPVRFSRLKQMGLSPAHYRHACQDEWFGTRSTRIGSGSHGLVLGKPVVEWPKTRRGKEWDAFVKETGPGVTILNKAEFEQAANIADAVRANADASRLLCDPSVIREQMIEWQWLGLSCTSTPDARGPGFVADLKTARTSEPGRFGRDGSFRAYHGQLAFYALAIEHLTGRRPGDAFLVAVESSPPYPVTVMQLTARAIERGERLCRMWMERLLGCIENNAWPGYCSGVTEFDVPDDEIGLVFADDEPAAESPLDPA